MTSEMISLSMMQFDNGELMSESTFSAESDPHLQSMIASRTPVVEVDLSLSLIDEDEAASPASYRLFAGSDSARLAG